jgi:hypothetical protein
VEDEDIRQAVSRAQAIVGDLDEPYRSVAFGAILSKLLVSGTPAARRVQEPRGPTALPRSLPELLAIANPRNHPDTAVLVAYYMWRSGDTAGMTVDELLGAYAQSRRPKPSNASDVLGKATRRGHLVEASEKKNGKKAWIVTPTGEAYAEALLERGRAAQ